MAEFVTSSVLATKTDDAGNSVWTRSRTIRSPQVRSKCLFLGTWTSSIVFFFVWRTTKKKRKRRNNYSTSEPESERETPNFCFRKISDPCQKEFMFPARVRLRTKKLLIKIFYSANTENSPEESEVSYKSTSLRHEVEENAEFKLADDSSQLITSWNL